MTALACNNRAIGSTLKQGGPDRGYQPKMKHFTALALDLPENRVGQAHSDQPLTTALNKLLRSRIDNNDNFTKIVKLNVSTERFNMLIKKSDS